jgi:flagellar motility protein MotE (MotC chaperone)
MTFLKIVWINLKTYGWIGFLILAAVFAFITVTKHRSQTQTTILDEIKAALANKQREMDELREAVKKAEEKNRRIQEAFEVTLLRINAEQNTAVKELTETQKAEIKTMIDQGKTPDQVATEVRNLLFGVRE